MLKANFLRVHTPNKDAYLPLVRFASVKMRRFVIRGIEP